MRSALSVAQVTWLTRFIHRATVTLVRMIHTLLSEPEAAGHLGGEPIPRTIAELQRRFLSYGYTTSECPRGEQAQILVRLLELYGRLGLLPDGRPAPLCQICANADACWATAPTEVRREPPDRYGEDDEDGGVCLPWVGPKYRPHGLVVLGINPNIGPGEHRKDYTDLLIEHGITWQHYVSSFRKGLKGEGGSRFGFGVMRCAAGLLDVLDGQPVRDREPEEFIDAITRIARLQAIKCVPRRRRSRPFDEMWNRCPPLLLAHELDILEPRRLLVLGEKPAKAVSKLRGFRPGHRIVVPAFSGLLARDGWRAEVYALPHPAAPAAEVSETAFLRSLRAGRRVEAGAHGKCP
jgi:hypothetical protein